MSTPGRGLARRSVPAAQNGFALVELLTVMLLIGVLAAIALPIFTDQREKSSDAEAKTLARAGAEAIELYSVEADNYDIPLNELRSITPELDTAADWEVSTAPTSYSLSVTATSGHIFTISRPSRTSPLQRECVVDGDKGSGGCPGSGIW